MASSTCDGCTLPDEQAEPDDTAIPARSKPITAVSALRPGSVNSVVFGNRDASSEKTIIPGVCFRPSSRSCLRPCRRTASSPKAAIAAAPPPGPPPPAAQQRLQPLHVLGQYHRADALGTADLVRRKRDKITT